MPADTKTPVLLSYAFRPFFLLNGLFAMAAIGAWTLNFHGMGLASLTVWWHAHEMIVGFAMAAVAGFSLTAVSVWTGRPAVHGAPLAVLLTCWLAGRLAMAFSQALPDAMLISLDMLFPVLLGLLFGREVLSSRNRRNYGLVIVIAFMAVVNLLYHLGLAGYLPGMERKAVYLLIHGMLLLVTVVAGRITPAFTRNWMNQKGMQPLPVTRQWVEKATFSLAVLTGLTVSLAPLHPAGGILAMLAALAHGIRLGAWRGRATVSNPLLFVLHAGYAWLPVGYLLLACSIFGWWFTPAAALHALTMGAVGSVVLAVTSRVSLGHTGRPLSAPRAIVFAYWIMAIAVLLRIAGTFTGGGYIVMIDLAATAWVLVFAIFLWVYWPILGKPTPTKG